jgi:hypothetical protein
MPDMGSRGTRLRRKRHDRSEDVSHYDPWLEPLDKTEESGMPTSVP